MPLTFNQQFPCLRDRLTGMDGVCWTGESRTRWTRERGSSVDPLTGFFLLLISQVVLPDAYSPGDDRVLHRDNASRLTKDAEKATGLRTGRRYRRWYEREGALEASVGQARPGHRHRDRHDDDQLVCKQSRYINGGRSRRASLKSSGHHDALEATRHDRT